MPQSLPNLSIDAKRLWSTLDRSSEIGTGPKGGLRRLALSDSDKEMRDQYVEWCEAIGCSVTVDAAGSIFARRAGEDDSLPPVVVGSHLDSQAAGGRFDGIRYGDELQRIGYLGETPVGGRDLDSYFELHIEQDSLMEEQDVSVGVVTGGYASHALTCVFHGECAHTGPTEMKKRKNAMIGAAYFLAAVNDIGWAHEPVGRASASRMQIWPNKFGILPEFTEVTVDMRHSDRAVTDKMVAKTRAALAEAADKANVEVEITAEWTFGDEVFDPGCSDLLRQAADARGISCMDIRSIAGHDAYYISRIAPTALVFSPCVDGITHNEAEDIRFEPTIEAVNVLFDAVVARADR